jgi:uncharacterized protein YfiM (DUF2279 family)
MTVMGSHLYGRATLRGWWIGRPCAGGWSRLPVVMGGAAYERR